MSARKPPPGSEVAPAAPAPNGAGPDRAARRRQAREVRREEARDLALTDLERGMLLGCQARDREIFRELVAPLQADFARLRAAVETRLALTSGAIGTRYRFSEDASRLEAVAAAEPAPPSAPEPATEPSPPP